MRYMHSREHRFYKICYNLSIYWSIILLKPPYHFSINLSFKINWILHCSTLVFYATTTWCHCVLFQNHTLLIYYILFNFASLGIFFIKFLIQRLDGLSVEWIHLLRLKEFDYIITDVMGHHFNRFFMCNRLIMLIILNIFK